MPFASKSAIQSRSDHLGICIIRNFRVPHKNPGIKATPTLEAQIFEKQDTPSNSFQRRSTSRRNISRGSSEEAKTENQGAFGDGSYQDERSIHYNKNNAISIIFD